jgi:hypothetical protein
MNAMNDELPRIQEQVYYGQINSHTDVLDKFLSESGIGCYNPQVNHSNTAIAYSSVLLWLLMMLCIHHISILCY